VRSSRDGTKALPTHRIDAAAAAALEIDAEDEPPGVRLRPRGEIDLGTAGRLRSEIEECVAAGCERVVVNLQGVTFLDSTGLHVILDADAAAHAAGWELLLIEGPAAVQRAFEVAGVRDRLPFVNAPHSRTPDPAVDVDAMRRQWQRLRNDAAALSAQSRQARRHAAEVCDEANAILDAAVLLVTDCLRRQGFALLAPVVASFRMAESGSTGIEIAVRLKDPSHAADAVAAIVERFPDRLSEVVVS